MRARVRACTDGVCVCSCARRMGRTAATDLRQRICESCET